jgi:hypothetical protein
MIDGSPRKDLREENSKKYNRGKATTGSSSNGKVVE